MADVHSKAQRSFNMSRIRSRDTGPEMKLRSALHRAGLRFRLHRRDLPGRPDIVLPKSQIAIFVHGCFWHQHTGCRYSTTPATNADFWIEKFRKNTERDKANIEELQRIGWTVLIVWECEIKMSVVAAAERIRTLSRTPDRGRASKAPTG